jgi:hypothetical protein
MTKQPDNDPFFLRLPEIFFSLVFIIIAHLLKLLAIILHKTAYNWLSIAGSCLLILVLTLLAVRLALQVKKQGQQVK